jgi:tRNA threonylcarbamoyladenosine biosynthesis protein TsaB
MLRILALETSNLTGGVTAAVDGKLLAEIDLEPAQRSARSLAPAIHALLAQIGWQPRDVQLAAVTTGPGSFTGLRVGVVTAKVFAYAAGCEVLGVSTLETIAAAAPPDIDRLSVAIDAQRGDVVAQDFQRGASGELDPLADGRLLPLGDWLSGLPPGYAVSGPVLKKWSGPFPPGVTVLPSDQWRPTAAHVARLAYRDYAAGRRDDLWRLSPVYSRASAAEEKWAARGTP